MHIIKYMLFSNVVEIINYTLTILIHATDGDEIAQIGFIISSGVIPSLLSFLKSKNEDVLILTLKLFNNFSYGSDNQTRVHNDIFLKKHIFLSII